jgi:hypothetical protein
MSNVRAETMKSTQTLGALETLRELTFDEIRVVAGGAECGGGMGAGGSCGGGGRGGGGSVGNSGGGRGGGRR